ncbi:hypothetical protein PWG71_15840 [Nocardiopsis sp. N85]|uniref:hypothetical protein n=1 Tax=Nocardiopsis sp. N85 TaxID=3029400 RepID=UPI00237F505D|nr:hypothetical protein [Nocardiopsis sp. N85]MDE3722861.1 hypothetical protein [Nocardiopsis sp. N85]
MNVGSEEGPLTAAGAHVYAAADLEERNTAYEVAEYAPGYPLVGDDSGGRGLPKRTGDPVSPVFASGLGDLAPEGFETVASDARTRISGLAP